MLLDASLRIVVEKGQNFHLCDTELNVIQMVTDWLECTMETDASIHDHMSTDEMYMVLQSDMVNIKQQEQALQTEILSIKNKFLNLLQHCGLENEFTFTTHHVTMATAADGTTTTTTDRSACNLHYSYADFLIEQLLASTSALTDSDLSPSPEETRNVFDDTPTPGAQVEAHNSLNSPGSGVRNHNYDNSNSVSRVLQEANIKVLPNQLDSTTSENCVPSSASSDSYPPSTSEEFSDNQVVPDLDLEKELISRVKYYSDFTIDRQRKINELLNKSKNLRFSRCRPNVFPGEDISQRTVEGAESKPVCMQRIPIRRAPSSSASSAATSSSGNSLYYPSKSKNKTSSSRSSRTSSHPLMSSTLIYEPTSNLPSSSTSGDSVYTWSIDENSEPGNLEQSYLRSRHRSQRSKSRKSSTNVSRCPTRRHHHRQQSQSSALHLTGLVSIIEPSSCVKKDNCGRNLCDDSNLGHKSQTLPRTSTRINLFAADSSCSMPNVNGHPSSDSSSPLHERTELPGKSSTSEGSNHVSNFGCSTITSMMVAPNVTECSRFTTEGDSSLIDSILTDSPKSVDSSGIFAPYNSPHATSVSSPCGYTTVSSSIPSTSSNDYCDYRGPMPTPATVKPSDPIFKIPHSPIARVKTCRRKSSTSRSPSVRTSTPRPFHSTAGSLHSVPAMRRKLFELNNNGQRTGEPRILDKKAIVRKFKKFSHHFKKDHTDKIKTLANL